MKRNSGQNLNAFCETENDPEKEAFMAIKFREFEQQYRLYKN